MGKITNLLWAISNATFGGLCINGYVEFPNDAYRFVYISIGIMNIAATAHFYKKAIEA